jgi:hypothetical protein
MIRRHADTGPDDAFVISRVEVVSCTRDGANYEVVTVWSRGFCAGMLTVRAGDGANIARWLLPDAAAETK